MWKFVFITRLRVRKTALVDAEGDEIGVLEVGEDGHLVDQEFLDGAWHVTKNGRSTIKTGGKAIEG